MAIFNMVNNSNTIFSVVKNSNTAEARLWTCVHLIVVSLIWLAAKYRFNHSSKGWSGFPIHAPHLELWFNLYVAWNRLGLFD